MAHHKPGWTWAVLGLNSTGTRVRLCTCPRKRQARQFIQLLMAFYRDNPRLHRDVKAWYMSEERAAGYPAAYAVNSSLPRTAPAKNAAAPRLAGLRRLASRFRPTTAALLLLIPLCLLGFGLAYLATLAVYLCLSSTGAGR